MRPVPVTWSACTWVFMAYTSFNPSSLITFRSLSTVLSTGSINFQYKHTFQRHFNMNISIKMNVKGDSSYGFAFSLHEIKLIKWFYEMPSFQDSSIRVSQKFRIWKCFYKKHLKIFFPIQGILKPFLSQKSNCLFQHNQGRT